MQATLRSWWFLERVLLCPVTWLGCSALRLTPGGAVGLLLSQKPLKASEPQTLSAPAETGRRVGPLPSRA